MLIKNPILAYHSTAEIPNLKVNTHPVLLDHHLEYLTQSGFEICSISTLLLLKSGGKRIGLSFDDGYINNINTISILKRYNAGATFFVLTGVSGQTMPYHNPHEVPLMGQEHWKILHKEGFEVGAHGVSHVDLSTLNREQKQFQIQKSIEMIKGALGTEQVGYAYPHGSFEKETLEIVSKYAHYGCALRYRGFSSMDRWKLKRIGVSDLDTPRRFRWKLSSVFRIMCDLGY